MVNGAKATLQIDLNMLDGDRIVTPAAFAVGGFIPTLSVGDLVEVVEGEGDRYLARVDGFAAGGGLIQLTVDLDSWMPKVEEAFAPASFVSGSTEVLVFDEPLPAIGGVAPPVAVS